MKDNNEPAADKGAPFIAMPSALVVQLGNMLGHAIAIAMAHPEVIAATRTLLVPSVAPPLPALLTRRELATALRVSAATIDRLGPPDVCVGDAASRRYDLAAVRAFLAEREPKPTTPARRVSAADDVDVSNLTARAGLRAVRGGR